MHVIMSNKRIGGLPNKRQLRLLIAITLLLIYGILVSHPIFCFEKKGVVKITITTSHVSFRQFVSLKMMSQRAKRKAPMVNSQDKQL